MIRRLREGVQLTLNGRNRGERGEGSFYRPIVGRERDRKYAGGEKKITNFEEKKGGGTFLRPNAWKRKGVSRGGGREHFELEETVDGTNIAGRREEVRDLGRVRSQSHDL